MVMKNIHYSCKDNCLEYMGNYRARKWETRTFISPTKGKFENFTGQLIVLLYQQMRGLGA